MSKKYEILRPKEYSGRQIALPEEEFWELAKDLEDMKLEISTLEKENQELKDKLLEVIERTLKKHDIDTYYGQCSCGFNFTNSKTHNWQHLFQEIKSAMEKEQNANQRKD